nr:polycomb group protein EMBRYONIC FLOWER 2-like isoform X1 [Ipomoea batatas]
MLGPRRGGADDGGRLRKKLRRGGDAIDSDLRLGCKGGEKAADVKLGYPATSLQTPIDDGERDPMASRLDRRTTVGVANRGERRLSQVRQAARNSKSPSFRLIPTSEDNEGLKCHFSACHDEFIFEYSVTDDVPDVYVSVNFDQKKSEIADVVDPRAETFIFSSKSLRCRKSQTVVKYPKHAKHISDLVFPTAVNELQHKTDGSNSA